MITTLLRPSASLPRVARLGFDDGWLLLPPTFLNLGVPVVIVDHAYVGDPHVLGLEPFGTRDPKAPLPMTDLVISSQGSIVIVRRRPTSQIVASACLLSDRGLPLLRSFTVAVLITGSTYELESTWAALWSMSIGRARLRAGWSTRESEERNESE